MIDSAVNQADKYKTFAKKVSVDGFSVLKNQDALRELMGDGVRAAAELAQLIAMPADPKEVL